MTKPDPSDETPITGAGSSSSTDPPADRAEGSIDEFRRYQVRTMPPGVRSTWMSAEIPEGGAETLADTFPPNQQKLEAAEPEKPEEPEIPHAKPYDPGAARLDDTIVSLRRRRDRNARLAKIAIFVLLGCATAVLIVQLRQSAQVPAADAASVLAATQPRSERQPPLPDVASPAPAEPSAADPAPPPSISPPEDATPAATKPTPPSRPGSTARKPAASQPSKPTRPPAPAVDTKTPFF